MKTRTACAALCLILAGCALNYPQNAEEFRRALPGATFGKVHSFEAKRPLRDVAKTFEARAPECLNKVVRMVERSSTSASTVVTTYKATVIGKPQRAELHVQQAMKGNVIVPGKVPPGGLYMLVADATPIDQGRTRVDIYAPSIGVGQVMVRAITGWASGENLGCPDLTKTS